MVWYLNILKTDTWIRALNFKVVSFSSSHAGLQMVTLSAFLYIYTDMERGGRGVLFFSPCEIQLFEPGFVLECPAFVLFFSAHTLFPPTVQ